MEMNVRLVAHYCTTPGFAPNKDWEKKDTAQELEEAERLYDEWYDSLPYEIRDKAFDITINHCRAHEQAAFERGMKAGAMLLAEMLGMGRVSS